MSGQSVLVSFLIDRDQNQLGEERVYFILHISGHGPTLQSGQELKQRSWRTTVSYLALHGSLLDFSLYSPGPPAQGAASHRVD